MNRVLLYSVKIFKSSRALNYIIALTSIRNDIAAIRIKSMRIYRFPSDNSYFSNKAWINVYL